MAAYFIAPYVVNDPNLVRIARLIRPSSKRSAATRGFAVIALSMNLRG